MSSIRLPPINDDDDVYDWTFHQEIMPRSQTAPQMIISTTTPHDGREDGDYFMGSSSRTLMMNDHHFQQCYNLDHSQRKDDDDDDQGILPGNKGLVKKGLNLKAGKNKPSLISDKKKKKKKILVRTDKSNNEEEEGTTSKKMDHNAKERIRRMKVRASYLALHQLLPDCRRSKKRRSAPIIVDKVLKYIPEIEEEIQCLKSKKLDIMESDSCTKSKKNEIVHDYRTDYSRHQSNTVSINKINHREAIVQICVVRKEDERGGLEGSLSMANLLQRVEGEDGEGICINSASMHSVCESIICYHLHAQMNHTSSGTDQCIEDIIRTKVTSWWLQR